MRPLDLTQVLAGSVDLDELLARPSVLVQYRRHFADNLDHLTLVDAGGSIAELVEEMIAAGRLPMEFRGAGSVFIDSRRVPHEFWPRVRLKSDAVVFLTVVPEGGDNTFALIAGLAVAAFAIAISGGALATLAPAIFGTVLGVAGPLAAIGTGIGAQLLGLAVGIGGSLLVQSMQKTPQLGGGGASAQPLGVAGIGGNPLGNTQPLPIIRGRIRVSPPIVAAPFTEIVASGQVGNVIFGVRAPVEITGTKIDGIDLDDVSQVEIEQSLDDTPLTLVTTSGFEESVNVQLRKQELQDDQATLYSNDDESYPLPYTMKTKRNCEKFRMVLTFPAGLWDNTGDDEKAILPIRIRIKPDGGAWINFPELILHSSNMAPMRRQILIDWSGPGDDAGKFGVADFVLVAYAKNPDWTADSYFNGGVTPTGVDTSVTNVATDLDSIVFNLDPDEFEVGPAYTVEITRGYALSEASFATSTYTSGGNPPGFYTYQFADGSDLKVASQHRYSSEVYLESYATLRNVYPILQDGLALTALRVRNRKVNSLSQIYTSVVPTWDGSDWDTLQASRNNSALALDVLRNPDNFVFSINDSKVDWESWQDYFEHCDSEGLTFDGLISDGSIEDPVRAILAAGDAELRRDGQVVGVVIDKDRSEEGITCLITPAVMVRPLTMEKSFAPFTTALVATFLDETDDYSAKEIFVEDGYMRNGRHLIEAIEVPGITNEAGAIRWCKIYLRRLRYRRLKYTFGTDLDHLLFKRGDLIGVAHDMLRNSYGSGRVKTWTTSGGNLTSITLDNDLLDAPPDFYTSLFDVEDVFTLSDFFTLARGEFGAELRLKDGFTTTVPISEVSGKTMTVDGAFALPVGLEAGCLAALGPRGREVHRVVVGDIGRESERQALITCFAEVSAAIFAGL